MKKPKTTGAKAAKAVRQISIDRKIDKYYLDDAAIEQADFFGFYADQKPPIKEAIDNKKVDLKVLMGEKFGHYKATLDGGTDAKGNAKDPTDSSVKSAIDCDKDVVALQKEIISLERELNEIDVALTTLDQRRSMIKVAQQLFSDEYWDNQRAIDTELMGSASKETKKKQKKAVLEEKLNDIEVEEGEDLEEEIEEEIIEETESSEEELKEESFDESEEEEETESGKDDVEDSEEEPEETEDPYAKDFKQINEFFDEDSEEETEDNNDSSGCPSGFTFGDDFGEYAECDDCDLETECWKKSKEK